MERNRKDRNGGVLDTVAELFDLPADLVAGLPHLEMMGSRQLYLEHHTGILAYSDEQIDVNTTGGVLRVRGARLALMAMTAEELRIGGSEEGAAFSYPLGLWIEGEDMLVCNAGSNSITEVNLTSFSAYDYAGFEEPVRQYLRVGETEIVMLDSGVYTL